MSSRLPDDEALPSSLVEAWRADEADETALRRAFLSFSARRAKGRSSVRLVLSGVLVGVVIGMGSVYAATGPLGLWHEPAQRSLAKAQPRRFATGLSRSTPPTPAPLPVVKAPVERINPVQPLPLASSEEGHGHDGKNSEQWQRAARGLRDSDYASAEAALAELMQRGSAAERESARLVRAQLLLTRGELDAASRELAELRSRAASRSVREKASELYERARQSQSPSRSFSDAPGANPP